MDILVLSRNSNLYSTESIVKAARKRGHFVRVVDHMYCDLVIDNDKFEVFYHGENISDYDTIIPRIGNNATNYGAAVVRHFELMGLFSTLQHEALLRTRNKTSSLQLLAANGIGVPRTVISNNSYMIEENIDYVGNMPIVVKLENGTQGIGVILAEKRRQAEAIVETLHGLKQQIMLQEYIGESKGSDVRVLIINDQIVAVMERSAKEGEFRSNLHRGGSSKVIQLNKIERETALKAAEIMGLKVCGVDMLRSKRGPLILEVNASPGLEGIENTTRIDVAGKIIQFCEKSLKN